MRAFIAFAVFMLCAAPVLSDSAPQTLDQLLERVKADRVLERKIDREREARFVAERDMRKQRLVEAEQRLQAEKARGRELGATYEENSQHLDALNRQLESRSADLGELFGALRQLAEDTAGTLKASMVSAQLPGRSQLASTLADSETLPSIEALEQLWHVILDEMVASGKVESFNTTVITRNGIEQQSEVVRVGTFNAVANGRFLRYLPENGGLMELSRQPELRYLKLAADLTNAAPGDTVDMALDPSRGAILALLTRTPGLWKRIQQGGYIGYAILALGVLGLLIVVERFIVLAYTGRKVKRQQLQPDQPRDSNPLGRLLLSHAEHARQDAQALVLRLEEKIQQELPRLQRGLSSLVAIATIVPLLGLLGTVTGMIATFQSITLFGAGDPKLMSGGISQALVTTELGLAVAIPLMLLHALLAGKSRTLIRALDEHSTALVAARVEHNGA